MTPNGRDDPGRSFCACRPYANSCPKVVSDEREGAESENGLGVLDPVPDGAAKRRFGPRKVGGICGLAPAQLVREAELCEESSVARLRSHLLLQRRESRRADTAGRTGERLILKRHRSSRRCRGRARLGEDPADEASESERRRSGSAHEKCRFVSHRVSSPLPYLCPVCS